MFPGDGIAKLFVPSMRVASNRVLLAAPDAVTRVAGGMAVVWLSWGWRSGMVAKNDASGIPVGLAAAAGTSGWINTARCGEGSHRTMGVMWECYIS